MCANRNPLRSINNLSSSMKRSKSGNDAEDDLGPSTFERELMMLDEADDLDEAILVDESDIVTAESKIILPKSWLRPPVSPVDPAKDKIIF
ncbi:unnamed protein product, partial [Hymenolepis diminuta]